MTGSHRTRSLLAALAFLAAGPPAEPSPAPVGRGAAVYAERCAECHGSSGRGDGPTAKRLGFRPRDLARASFKCRCTPSGELPTDADLARTVRQGLPGTPMLGFADVLPDADVDAVVSFVKTLSPAFARARAVSCIEVPAAPARDEASVGRGERIYRLLGCWQCHGKTGRGDGPGASTLRDDFGDPAKPGRFAATGKLKCGGSDADLYRTLHTGLTGSPMPSYTEAFLFSSATKPNEAALRAAFGEADEDEVEAFLGEQPSAEAVASLGEVERAALVSRRTWDLVFYLRSLIEAK